MSKTLDQLSSDVADIFKKYEQQGTKPWTYHTASLDISYQVGSLAKRIGQLENTRYADNLSKQELKLLIADELADIMAEVLFIAQDLKIDMNAAWEAMLQSDQEKITLRSQKNANHKD